jgi:Tfp pilus assembly protein PilN
MSMRDINLLPGEIAAEEASRRNRVYWLFALIALVALLAWFSVGRLSAIGDAEDDLTAQQQVNADLDAEIGSLGQFEGPLQAFEARTQLMSTALEGDVSWARLLNDLGRFIPDRVWLDSLQGDLDQAVVNGTAFEYEDVANWLRAVDNSNYAGLSSSWVGSLNASDVSGVGVVSFQSTAQLTDEALGQRLASRIPEIS